MYSRNGCKNPEMLQFHNYTSSLISLTYKSVKKKKRRSTVHKKVWFFFFLFSLNPQKRENTIVHALSKHPRSSPKLCKAHCEVWSTHTHTKKKYMRHTHTTTKKHDMSSVHGNEWNVHSRWWTKPELFVTWCLDPRVYGLILCASCWWNWTKHCPLHRCTLHTRQPQTDFTPCPFVVRFFAFSQRWHFFFVPG